MDNRVRTELEDGAFPLPVTPFGSPDEVLHYYGALFITICLRYLNLRVESIVNDSGGYAPKSPSVIEMIHTLSGEPSKQGTDWLKSRDLPPLARCEQMIALFSEHIRLRTQKTRDEAPEASESILYLDALQKRFSLSALELHVLIAAVLIQFDERYAHAWQYASGASRDEMPLAGFLLSLFDFVSEDPAEHHKCFLPQSPLVRYGLVSLRQNPSWGAYTPTIYASLVVPKGIVAYLLGETSAYIPDACSIASKVDVSNFPRSENEEHIYRRMKHDAYQIALLGYSGIGREHALVRSAQFMGQPVVCMSFNKLSKIALQSQANARELIADVIRETLIRNAVLWVDCQDISSETQGWLDLHADTIHGLFENETDLRLCVRLQRQTALSRKLFGELTEILFSSPGREEQPALWFDALHPILGEAAARQVSEIMSEGYCLSLTEIQDTIEKTLARFNTSETASVLTSDNLTDTLNRTRGHKLDGLATLRSTSLYLRDIVLSEETRKVLDDILNYARYSEKVMRDWGFAKYNLSGAGLSVLLSGVPGTGKTLTALVLAHELGRALYVVDLSRVVDKYIGETEKKLSQIFDEAESSQAMLLFDEADSLFAKRTDVKSSNDRYANLGVNYLLQRLEAYRGVSILTTNFSGGLDEALARRIQFKIEFPMPDALQRTELWRRLIPKNAPCDKDIDLEAIAEHFEMSGGHIKNAIFRASINAAATQSTITHDMLWDAAVHEYRSMGHIICENYGNEEIL
ncbi:MAG: AAA family ATPase [Bradymonadales bacterium]|jgi:AAA+ superfamily predicted ATPase